MILEYYMTETPTRIPYNLEFLEAVVGLDEHRGAQMSDERATLAVARDELTRLAQDDAYRAEHTDQYLVIQDGVPQWIPTMAGVDRENATVFHYTQSPYGPGLDMLLEEEPSPERIPYSSEFIAAVEALHRHKEES